MIDFYTVQDAENEALRDRLKLDKEYAARAMMLVKTHRGYLTRKEAEAIIQALDGIIKGK